MALSHSERTQLVAITNRLEEGFSPAAQELFIGNTIANVMLWIRGRMQALGYGWRDYVQFEFHSEVPHGFGIERASLKVQRRGLLGGSFERLLPGETKSPEISVITPELMSGASQRIIATQVPENQIVHIMPLSHNGMLVERGLSTDPPPPTRLSAKNAMRVPGPDGYRTVKCCADQCGNPNSIVGEAHRAVFATIFLKKNLLAEKCEICGP